MNERWQKIDRIFEELFALPESERAERLAALTAGDPELKAEVESLLGQPAPAKGFLELGSTFARDLRGALLGDFLVGKQLGPYRLDVLIGEGGMGLVYRATDTRGAGGDSVALKVLPPEAVRDPARRQQFEREKSALEKINHPGVVRLLDFGEHAGFSYLVMEYFSGKTLREYLRETPAGRTGPAALIPQFLSALSAVHRAGLVHGDLKPENLMVNEAGLLKLVDFGLATQVSPSALRATVAEFGLAGTIAYAAPERIRGEAPSPAADVFAAGSILYEMLTGRQLYEGKTPWAIAEQILQGRPDLSAAPPDWRRLLRGCLAAKPSHRPADALAIEKGMARQSGKRLRILAAAALLVLAAAPVAWRWAASEIPLPVGNISLGQEVQPYVSFSSDGKWLAYSQRDPEQLEQAHVFLRPTNGKLARQITTGPFRDRYPSLAENGRAVYFESNRSPQGIYYQRVGEPTARLVVEKWFAPRVSPDSKWLAYFLHSVSLADPEAGKPGVVMVSLEKGFVQKWVNGDAVPHAPVLWRDTGAEIIVLVSTPGTPSPRARAVAIEPATGFQRMHDNQFHGYCGWTPSGVLLGFTPVDGIQPEGLLTKNAASGYFYGETGVESCEVRNGVLWTVQVQRDRGILAANLNPRSELPGSGFAMDPSLGGSHNISLSLDGRWMAYYLADGNAMRLVTRDNAARSQREVGDLPSAGLSTHPLPASGKWILLDTLNRGVPQFRALTLPELKPIGRPLPVEAIAWDSALAGQVVLCASTTSPRSVRAISVESGESWTAVSSPKHNLYLARVSPDERWLVFTAEETGRPGGPILYAAPFRPGRFAPAKEWVPLGQGDYPHWSASGNMVYFLDERRPVAKLRAQPLAPETKRPMGDPVDLFSFDGEWRPSRLQPGTFRIAASRDRILVSVGRDRTFLWKTPLR
ncbi:MAG: serine/threonine-protein kinase [Acidobacteria bacterium]|nr:serine/threonine-protein kinase [Acidobacteriota bacterium]